MAMKRHKRSGHKRLEHKRECEREGMWVHGRASRGWGTRGRAWEGGTRDWVAMRERASMRQSKRLGMRGQEQECKCEMTSVRTQGMRQRGHDMEVV